MRLLLVVLGILFAAVPAYASNYEFFDAPVKVKYFKENAEGMVSEGFEVKDKNDRYTISCKVKNGTPSLIRFSDGFIAKMTKKPSQYLSDVRGYTTVELQWSEVCKRLVK